MQSEARLSQGQRNTNPLPSPLSSSTSSLLRSLLSSCCSCFPPSLKTWFPRRLEVEAFSGSQPGTPREPKGLPEHIRGLYLAGWLWSRATWCRLDDHYVPERAGVPGFWGQEGAHTQTVCESLTCARVWCLAESLGCSCESCTETGACSHARDPRKAPSATFCSWQKAAVLEKRDRERAALASTSPPPPSPVLTKQGLTKPGDRKASGGH